MSKGSGFKIEMSQSGDSSVEPVEKLIRKQEI